MIDRISGVRTCAVVAFASKMALLAAICSPAAAADASPWDGGPRAAVRLIAASSSQTAPGGALPAGIEIRLGTGWKTYWRYAGDSGVPPRFRFDRSENVRDVAVLFPAPHGFNDESGESIGYKGEVILPLRVTPRDAAKPVLLRLDIDYAICSNLCIPVTGKAELQLPGDGEKDAALAASEARVPKPVALGADGALSIRVIRREDGGAHPRMIVDVAAPPDAKVALFAEGPTPDWALPIPSPVAGAPAGQQRFTFDLDGLPPGASAKGATLRLTAVTETTAIEVTTVLE
ncbi:MAG: cytochrome C biogenesis protein [Hyphomicrobiales bacterium]|nr:cytochrome C biogenesis protein [Hyphomicrobiales bacterium]MBV9427460.1 cytochrome C biogenesis protein [Bradyrhizobiaceae bacterium]